MKNDNSKREQFRERLLEEVIKKIVTPLVLELGKDILDQSDEMVYDSVMKIYDEVVEGSDDNVK